MIELVDIDCGNIGSVSRCLERLEIPYRKVGPDKPPSGNVPLVLPGVGAFGAVMSALSRNGFDGVVKNLVRQGVPFLGICVGLQVLFEHSEESLGIPGLGLLSGRVVPYRQGKVPQIGWNRIASPEAKDWPEGFVYFVNSYYAVPTNPDDVLYTGDYHGNFCAAVQSGNITAFQFHPEKSGTFGHELVRKWVAAVV